MRKSTKMLLAAGRGGNRSEMEPGRMEYGGYGEENRRGGRGNRSEYGEGGRMEYGGYGEENRRRGGGSRSEYGAGGRMEYGEGGRGNRSEYGGYEGEENRRRGGGSRSEYGGYEGEESRRRRDRRGRFTRSGGYDEDDEDEDPRIAAQYEDDWPMRGGYAPRREQMPRSGPEMQPPNVIGFNTMPPHQQRGGEAMSAEFPRHMADEWTATMKNEDGTTGPHWSFEQAKQLMAGKGLKLDPVEFWAALNMMYSDYCKIAKKHNVNTVDFYAGLAEAFLNDKDAGEGKLRKYYEYIVK